MKKLIFILSALLCTVCLNAQNDAKSVLDKASAVFTKDGGIKAEFKMQITQQGGKSGQTNGTICIKEDKFVMETPDAITWFNGITQWSYLVSADEVNISNPSREELQSINPYLLLSMYKKGYTYQLGQAQTFHGKQIHEVILKPENKSNDILSITLNIQKFTYQPVYIELLQKNQSITRITVTRYQTGEKFPDKLFVFDKKKYPDAEEIDLR